jgi:cobalt-precorrin 5A hydrolase
MKIAAIAFSVCGAALVKRILALGGCDGNGYIARRHAEGTGFEPFDSVYELTARLFQDTDALVFVGACGIAVRAVAPLVRSKLTDPAVVVCDETGRFAVSLLSGHAGGANTLAERIAAHIGATPVVTTASDARAALSGSEQPRSLVLGIGCRRGLTAETIERAVTILLWDANIPLARVREAATIDIKREEAGLLGFAAAHNLPLRFYSAEELTAVPGVFSASERVLQAVGVGNVCERAAVLCGGKGSLILKKTARDGVTVAAFERD